MEFRTTTPLRPGLDMGTQFPPGMNWRGQGWEMGDPKGAANCVNQFGISLSGFSC